MECEGLDVEDRALVRRVLAAPAEVRAAILVLLEAAGAPNGADLPQGFARPAMTDREVAGATLVAVGELAVRLTGEPLKIKAPVEGGYLGLRVP